MYLFYFKYKVIWRKKIVSEWERKENGSLGGKNKEGFLGLFLDWFEIICVLLIVCFVICISYRI